MLRQQFFHVALWMACVSLASVAEAQQQQQQQQQGSNTRFAAPPYYGFSGGGMGGFGGGFGWGNLGAGSTPMGSYLSGMGEAIRAEGQYNLMSSEAAVNLQEARRANIDNSVRWTNAFFEQRKIHQAYMDSQRKPPVPPETWVRLAQEASPQRLNTSMLDPVTGHINWPSLLQGPEFGEDRKELDKLFAERAIARGAVGIDGHAKIQRTVDDAMSKLRDRINQISPRNFMEARNFLRSLAFEANFGTNS